MNGASIHDNKTTFSNGSAIKVAGENGIFYFNSGEIYNNENNNPSGVGGTVYITSKATINMKDGIIRDNKVVTGTGNLSPGYGGGIYIVGATANLSGGKITENEVSFSGGGICALYDANVNISDDMEISNNTSVVFGGGIYASNAIINIDGGKIFGNSTTMGGAAGGAIYIDNARNNTSITSLDISGGEIFDNTTDLNYGNAIAIGYGNNINFNLKGSPEIKGEIVFFTDELR